jgi:hypothetical protein
MSINSFLDCFFYIYSNQITEFGVLFHDGILNILEFENEIIVWGWFSIGPNSQRPNELSGKCPNKI